MVGPTRAHFHAAPYRFLAVTGGAAAGVGAAWRSQTAAVGVARSEHQLRVFTPFAARIEQIRTVGNVAAGSTLLTLQEPDISARISSSEAGLRGYQARLAGLLADTSGLEQQAATRQRINVQAQETQAARLEVARLTLTAPFAGRWLDVDPTLRPGQWVNAKTQLGILVDPQHWQVDAYVKQDDLQQIKLGAAVRFYPHGQTSVLAGSVLSVSSTRVKQLEQPLLASRYKGPIPVAAERDTLVPNPAVFHVLVQLDQPPPGLWETRGELQIEASAAAYWARQADTCWRPCCERAGFSVIARCLMSTFPPGSSWSERHRRWQTR